MNSEIMINKKIAGEGSYLAQWKTHWAQHTVWGRL
jgi:hypothetical protein